MSGPRAGNHPPVGLEVLGHGPAARRARHRANVTRRKEEDMSGMIEDPETYFRQFVPAGDPLLLELEKEARAERIPIVGPVVGELLYVLARAMSAKAVLELGAATGYSAIFLARACAENAGALTTLEHDPELAARARGNLERAGLGRHAEVVCGDALARVTELAGPFDLVFLDIDKADYARALPDCHRLLRDGGLLVADNVAFADADDFNRHIFADGGWTPVPLYAFLPQHSPEMDALCLALRR
jgi:caffeoyl-CoA O-methyltransferase